METADVFTGAGVFPSGLGDQQPGFFPNPYNMAHGIEERTLDFELGDDWDLSGILAPTLNPFDANACPTSQKTTLTGQGFPTNTIDPTNLRSDSNTSHPDWCIRNNTPGDAGSATFSSTPQLGNGSISSAASTDYKLSPSTSPFSVAQAEPNPTDRADRARHAANERHKRSRTTRKDSHQSDNEEVPKTEDSEADLKQRKLREKNKVAAAKCRSRHRKQVKNIESKCNHLSAANGELKRQIRDLSGELSDLRSLALNHQTCECNIAMYNYQQAQKVVAGLQASSMEKDASQMLSV